MVNLRAFCLRSFETVFSAKSNKKKQLKKNARIWVEYTGSPDSEKVATMLDSFHYRPDQQEIVLRKYN